MAKQRTTGCSEPRYHDTTTRARTTGAGRFEEGGVCLVAWVGRNANRPTRQPGFLHVSHPASWSSPSTPRALARARNPGWVLLQDRHGLLPGKEPRNPRRINFVFSSPPEVIRGLLQWGYSSATSRGAKAPRPSSTPPPPLFPSPPRCRPGQPHALHHARAPPYQSGRDARRAHACRLLVEGVMENLWSPLECVLCHGSCGPGTPMDPSQPS